MGNPFKDQFLKKGLVTKKQANRASHEKRLARPKKRNEKTVAIPGPQDKLRKARQEQATRDRELNRQQNEAVKEKEIHCQIRQIIKQNRVEVKGDISFHFADGKKIQKLYVSKDIVDALSKGIMAIVNIDEQYTVVHAKAGIQIRDRNAGSLILLNSQIKKELASDDPYAEFPIPDDYGW